MLCPTCKGRGVIERPYIAGVVTVQHPCPDCHAGHQHCCDGDCEQPEGDADAHDQDTASGR